MTVNVLLQHQKHLYISSAEGLEFPQSQLSFFFSISTKGIIYRYQMLMLQHTATCKERVNLDLSKPVSFATCNGNSTIFRVKVKGFSHPAHACTGIQR